MQKMRMRRLLEVAWQSNSHLKCRPRVLRSLATEPRQLVFERCSARREAPGAALGTPGT